MRKLALLMSLAVIISNSLFGQNTGAKQATVFHPEASAFDRQDTLRGSITPERVWWDLTYYHLEVDVDIKHKSIKGKNFMLYKVLKPADILQLDLQEPMNILSIEQDGRPLEFCREGNAFFIKLEKQQLPGQMNSLSIKYEGKPRQAKRAPWDGGFSWDTDSERNPFVATSCQGLGASSWWPCKDHPYDEPDSVDLSFTVPESLVAVSNGRLVSTKPASEGKITWNWKVRNPINHYGVNLNIGKYVHFSEVYSGEKGPLDCDYYVLEKYLQQAKEQFKQVPLMLEAFEHWFGPYPFYEDGYKLVQVPYLGMEHQSSVTYGNKFGNGYLGRDLSGTGQGLKFDFIIIHESAHEWFANSITYKDVADMWIHESFGQYAEGLYMEYHFGKEAGYEYLRGLRRTIRNDIPIIGIYNVNQEGSGDMYAKGANMLHTIRQLVGDDDKWRSLLRGINHDFFHSNVSTEQIEGYMIHYTGLDLKPIFDQYLRRIQIPKLQYYFEDNTLLYRWIDVADDFNMPAEISINERYFLIKPRSTWQRLPLDFTPAKLLINPNYYVNSEHESAD